MLLDEILLIENRLPTIKRMLANAVQQKLDANPSGKFQSSDHLIDHISSFDPSKNKQYTQWLINQYLKKGLKIEDLYKTKQDLEQFDKIKTQLEKRDINQYDHTSLYQAISSTTPQISNKQQKRQIKTQGADVVLEGPDCTILKLKTKEAACFYGKGTRWCTAASKSDNMFDEYNKDGPLYVAMCDDGRKFQFHINSGQYMDEHDSPVKVDQLRAKYPTIDKFFTQTVMPAVLRNAHAAYNYARNIIKGRWREAEPVIMKDAEVARLYASLVIKGRWPEAEPVIMKNADVAYRYAVENVRGRWPEAEHVIMKSPVTATQYARNIIGGRWPEAEPVIMKDAEAARLYASNIIKGRWPEAEPVIMKDAEAARRYAKTVFRGRWPEAEPVIMKDAMVAYMYAVENIGGRWPEAEPVIMKNAVVASWYARNVIKGRWPEAEPVIMKDADAARHYAKNVIKGPWPEAGIK